MNTLVSTLTEFKLLADVFVEQLAERRAKYNQSPLKGEALDQYIKEQMPEYNQWRISAMSQLGALGKLLNAEEKKEAQEYIVNSKANSFCQEGPFPWRIFNKPEGYAGDAELMRMIYEDKIEGDTPWGKHIHKNSLEYRCCNAVRNRKQYLKTKLKEQSTGKVLSMAAGPASEVQEFLAENPSNEIDFLALDHDINTLRRVNNNDPRLTYAIANAFQFIKGKNQIAYPRSTFKDVLDPTIDFKGARAILAPLKYKIEKLKSNSYDLVYSAGLYDYIINFEDKTKGVKALTKFLFDLVKPGGKLIIGNFSKDVPDDEYFALEFLIDWILIYRNDKEILSFADAINSDEIQSIKIEKEEEGINSFLVIRKK